MCSTFATEEPLRSSLSTPTPIEVGTWDLKELALNTAKRQLTVVLGFCDIYGRETVGVAMASG